MFFDKPGCARSIQDRREDFEQIDNVCRTITDAGAPAFANRIRTEAADRETGDSVLVAGRVVTGLIGLPPMTAYVIRRVIAMLPALLGIAFITFGLMHLTPSGPFSSEHTNPDIYALSNRIPGMDESHSLGPPLTKRTRKHHGLGAVRPRRANVK